MYVPGGAGLNHHDLLNIQLTKYESKRTDHAIVDHKDLIQL